MAKHLAENKKNTNNNSGNIIDYKDEIINTINDKVLYFRHGNFFTDDTINKYYIRKAMPPKRNYENETKGSHYSYCLRGDARNNSRITKSTINKINASLKFLKSKNIQKIFINNILNLIDENRFNDSSKIKKVKNEIKKNMKNNIYFSNECNLKNWEDMRDYCLKDCNNENCIARLISNLFIYIKESDYSSFITPNNIITIKFEKNEELYNKTIKFLSEEIFTNQEFEDGKIKDRINELTIDDAYYLSSKIENTFPYFNKKEQTLLILYPAIESSILIWLVNSSLYNIACSVLLNNNTSKYNKIKFFCIINNSILSNSISVVDTKKKFLIRNKSKMNILNKDIPIDNNNFNYMFCSFLTYRHFLTSYISSNINKYEEIILEKFTKTKKINSLVLLQYKMIKYDFNSIFNEESIYYQTYKKHFELFIQNNNTDFIFFKTLDSMNDVEILSNLQYIICSNAIVTNSQMSLFLLELFFIKNKFTFNGIILELLLAYQDISKLFIYLNNYYINSHTKHFKNSLVSTSYRVFVYSNYYENLVNFENLDINHIIQTLDYEIQKYQKYIQIKDNC